MLISKMCLPRRKKISDKQTNTHNEQGVKSKDKPCICLKCDSPPLSAQVIIYDQVTLRGYFL